MFRGLLKSHRCLVPASGFYEWQAGLRGKVPFYIHLRQKPLIAFAGLYDVWTREPGQQLFTFTIITTRPNAIMAPIHDRMPLMSFSQSLCDEKGVGGLLQAPDLAVSDCREMGESGFQPPPFLRNAEIVPENDHVIARLEVLVPFRIELSNSAKNGKKSLTVFSHPISDARRSNVLAGSVPQES